VIEGDARSLYLDLIRRNLTRYGLHERIPALWPLRRRLFLKTVNFQLVRAHAHRLARATPNALPRPFVQRNRDLGLAWRPGWR
jgi:O-methyltransferase